MPDVETSCPALAAARDSWLRHAIQRLHSIPEVAGAALVGSLGRGTSDDWSDVDLFLVSPFPPKSVITTDTLSTFGEITIHSSSSHNTRADAHAFGAGFVVDGLIVHTDWYVFPLEKAGWPRDAIPIVGGDAIPVSTQGFDEINGVGPRGSAPHRTDAEDRRSRFMLVPLAAKHLVRRRSSDASALIGLITGSSFTGDRAEGLAVLRQFIQDVGGDLDGSTCRATSAVLDLAQAAFDGARYP